MKSKITKNFVLKLLSLLIAFLLWLVVVNLADPTETRKFSNIPVEILNEQVISDVNRVYEVTDGETVDVVVKGKRSIVDKLSDTDFRATADLSKLSKVNAVSINVTLNTKNASSVELDWGDAVMKVSLEKKTTKQFKVNVKTDGDLEDGYLLGDMMAQPNILEVAGGQSTINRIAAVAVVVPLEGRTGDFTQKLSPVLYDSDGNVINGDEVTFNEDTVSVSVNILPTKEVAVKFNITGTPAEGYRLVSSDYKPEVIQVAGEKEALESLTSIELPINIDGENRTIEKEIDVTKYLPEGVKVASDSAAISLRCVIQKNGSRTFDLTNSDLKVVNLPDNMNFSFVNSNEKYTVEITGTEANLEGIKLADLNAYIDVDGYDVGTHTVTVLFNLPTDIKTKTKIKVKVKLSSTTDDGTTPAETTVPDISTPAPTEAE